MKERLKKQIKFIKEIDKEKTITRQTLLTNGIQKEDDAQHAWHMAIMTLLLSEYANEEIDILKTIQKGIKTQREREIKAADRIFGLLPEDQKVKFRMLWEEFENNETPEAHFAHTMDNFQPIMLNDATNGKMWEENKVRLSQILKRNEKTKLGSKILWEYSYKNFIEPNVKKKKIIDDTNL